MPLGLAKLQIEVRIFGPVAETTSTMTFANPTARPMEGDLYFPLPEGATISGYALDINGQMIDGVAVEKHEARLVFEEVMRHGIDPGLVQWTKGNNFQTRVFPIPAHGSRTVRVSYVTELLGDRKAPAAYDLPLKFKSKVPEFSLRVEVVKPSAPPNVSKGELTNFTFKKWHESYVAETKQQDWSPVEDLVIALPKEDGPQVVVEKADDGQYYFAVQDYWTAPKEASSVVNVKRAVVVWDASGSRIGDHKREMVVLQHYLERLLPATAEEAKMEVDLVLLRNALAKPVRLEFSRSNPSVLAGELEKVQYDGGTQLGAIGPIAGDEKPDLYLLFTDGISNFGREEPAKLDAPLVIFSADAVANHAFLRARNGQRWAVFQLSKLEGRRYRGPGGCSAWSFLSAAIHQAGVTTKDVFPQVSQPVERQMTVVGKLSPGKAKVEMVYGFPGDDQGNIEVETEITSADAVNGSLLRRLWRKRSWPIC